jgi:polyhydroxybutyrate depolymerase
LGSRGVKKPGCNRTSEVKKEYIVSKELLTFTILIVLSISASCGDSKNTIIVDGVEREYYVHAPESYDGSEPVPLVLALHGGGGNAEKMDKLTGFNDVADREGFIVVYPEGVNKHWNDGRENVFAAVAGVAAQVSTALEEKYPPEGPVAVMMVLGDEDPLVPYEGGEVQIFGIKRGEVLSAEESVAMWTENNGCSGAPETTYYDDIDGDDGSVVRRDEYVSDIGADVVLLTVEGGGHTWPGGRQYLPAKVVGETNRDISASDVIWEFFEGHRLE